MEEVIKINLCIEELKYRNFGLFPFLAKNELGDLILFKGNTMVDGCYNQLSCAFKLPLSCSLIINNNTLIKGGKSYTFNTLYHYYKQYQNLTNNEFIKFIKRGLGKKEVDVNVDWDVCDLVPTQVNLSECKRLYEDLFKLKTICENYIQQKEQTGNVNCDFECILDKYNRMGGDVMLNFYHNLQEEANNIADEYFEYADLDNSRYCINIAINSKIHDMGVVESLDELSVTDDVNNEQDNIVTITGITDSKLKTFRKTSDYISTWGEVITPTENEDWLYYYRIGYLAHYDAETDEDGNIQIFDGANRVTPQKIQNENGDYEYIYDYDTNLIAYGDILTNIEYDETEKQIIFTYKIGCHLKAQCIEITKNQLNKKFYKYDKFEYESGGVEYKEKYYYEIDSEIDKLINGEYDGVTFEQYISTILIPGMEFFKGSFRTDLNINHGVGIINGSNYEYSYLPAKFEFDTIQNKTYDLNAPIMHKDYYDSILFNPIVKNNVKFSRGNSAAFEKHIKLGEVKSFDDLLNYGNGSFFNVI